MTASHEHPVAATPAYGSDVIVDLLAELDVPYVAFNPGASFRGLHDSLVNHANGTPQPIACLHEEISVAIAHGYAKATGRQMAAAVHDVVGLQHATMAVYNAWCDRVPLLLLGATGPVDAAKRRPWIDWIHTAQVQANQVRDYTKWDDQPASLEAVPESLIRAAQISDTAPRGPVYICFDTEIQEQPVPQGWAPPVVASFAAPRRAAPDPAAVAELAGWLVGARAPVVLADYVGREQRAVEQLVALAELAGLAVVDLERSYNKVSLNFPTQHPLNLSGDAPAVLDAADVVIGLEARDLFGALNRVAPGGRVDPRHPGTARIASIGMGPCVKSAWSADYQRLQPCDLQLLCEPGPLLTALMPAVEAAFAEQPEAGARAGGRRCGRRGEPKLGPRARTHRSPAPSSPPSSTTSPAADRASSPTARWTTGSTGCGRWSAPRSTWATPAAGGWATAWARRWGRRWRTATTITSSSTCSPTVTRSSPRAPCGPPPANACRCWSSWTTTAATTTPSSTPSGWRSRAAARATGARRRT
jgi:benzoylformate decarboxylase/acetolactate synthase-1/2/3 large subunit